MSEYTTQVRWICEMKSGYYPDQMEGKTPDDFISAAIPKIFNFDYPIYDESHRVPLEHKILRHYYTREIAAETFELWHLWLNDKLNLIMPKYNKLYEAEHAILGKELKNIDVDITSTRTDDLLKESDYTRTDNLTRTDDLTRTDNLTRTDDLTKTDNLAHSETTSKTVKDRFSDTPQGGVTYADADSGNVYLTTYERTDDNGSASGTNTGTVKDTGTVTNTGTVKDTGTVKNTGTQTNEGSEANTGTVENESHEKGYRGEKIYAELIAAYADKVLNIDQMIINELYDLFFLLW